MARTLSISDEETGVTASMRVEEVDGQSRVTVLHFAAVEGFGITSEHLRMLQDGFGLKLPAGLALTSAPPVVPMEPPAPKNPAREKKPTPPRQRTAPATRTRKNYTGGVPSDAALLSVWAQHGGSVRAVAEAIGASTSAVNRWIGAARQRGVAFTAEVPAGAGASS